MIVVIDAIFGAGVTLLEELLCDADPAQPLHLMLASPGGDGEVAIRMIKAMQASGSSLTIIVPDMAKSAATLMCLGADVIRMSPASDLGPVDPQFAPLPDRGALVSAHEIQKAVEDAEARVAADPNTYELYASLLADVNMLMVEQARSALARTEPLMAEALGCVRTRSQQDVDALKEALIGPLQEHSSVHGATIGPEVAGQLGLPVELVDRSDPAWQIVWNLWTRYFYLGCFPAGNLAVYENYRASQIMSAG